MHKTNREYVCEGTKSFYIVHKEFKKIDGNLQATFLRVEESSVVASYKTTKLIFKN